MPTRSDNGKSLTCRANNPVVKGGVEEATIKLNVFCEYFPVHLEDAVILVLNIIYLMFELVFLDVPILHLSLGSNLNPDDIEEGDDVYFECKVNANPWAYKVVWKHNVSYKDVVMHAHVMRKSRLLFDIIYLARVNII